MNWIISILLNYFNINKYIPSRQAANHDYNPSELIFGSGFQSSGNLFLFKTGKMGVDILMERIAADLSYADKKFISKKLEPELVIRDSCRELHR